MKSGTLNTTSSVVPSRVMPKWLKKKEKRRGGTPSWQRYSNPATWLKFIFVIALMQRDNPLEVGCSTICVHIQARVCFVMTRFKVTWQLPSILKHWRVVVINLFVRHFLYSLQSTIHMSIHVHPQGRLLPHGLYA